MVDSYIKYLNIKEPRSNRGLEKLISKEEAESNKKVQDDKAAESKKKEEGK